MAILDPTQAAGIAHGVYTLRDEPSKAATFGKKADLLNIDGIFGGAQRFEGTSGPLIFKELSGFGYVAAGVGPFAGDILLATRGTDTKADWLTDFNIGVQFGPSGKMVHAGFHDTWKSFAPAVREFLRGRNPTRIHCVGHSLGGALAFLNADFITANRIADVRVYTFGAPRTGVEGFARQLTERVGKENIYRVSNPCDPVPMIPLFPFFHAPFNLDGLEIARTSSALISGAGHKMETAYLANVANKSWQNLRVNRPDDREVKGWVDGGVAGVAGGVMGSAKLMDMINRVMNYLLTAAKAVVGLVFTAGFTVLDQLAWMLTRAAQISSEMGSATRMLIGLIFKFLGRTAMAGVQITTAFLRWVLDLLFTSIRAAAVRALALMR